MVDTDRIVELLPHYVAMFAVIFLALAVLRLTVGYLGFWVELVVVLAIAVAYPAATRRLGVAPSSWE